MQNRRPLTPPRQYRVGPPEPPGAPGSARGGGPPGPPGSGSRFHPVNPARRFPTPPPAARIPPSSLSPSTSSAVPWANSAKTGGGSTGGGATGGGGGRMGGINNVGKPNKPKEDDFGLSMLDFLSDVSSVSEQQPVASPLGGGGRSSIGGGRSSGMFEEEGVLRSRPSAALKMPHAAEIAAVVKQKTTDEHPNQSSLKSKTANKTVKINPIFTKFQNFSRKAVRHQHLENAKTAAAKLHSHSSHSHVNMMKQSHKKHMQISGHSDGLHSDDLHSDHSEDAHHHEALARSSDEDSRASSIPVYIPPDSQNAVYVGNNFGNDVGSHVDSDDSDAHIEQQPDKGKGIKLNKTDLMMGNIPGSGKRRSGDDSILEDHSRPSSKFRHIDVKGKKGKMISSTPISNGNTPRKNSKESNKGVQTNQLQSAPRHGNIITANSATTTSATAITSATLPISLRRQPVPTKSTASQTDKIPGLAALLDSVPRQPIHVKVLSTIREKKGADAGVVAATLMGLDPDSAAGRNVAAKARKKMRAPEHRGSIKFSNEKTNVISLQECLEECDEKADKNEQRQQRYSKIENGLAKSVRSSAKSIKSHNDSVMEKLTKAEREGSDSETHLLAASNGTSLLKQAVASSLRQSATPDRPQVNIQVTKDNDVSAHDIPGGGGRASRAQVVAHYAHLSDCSSEELSDPLSDSEHDSPDSSNSEDWKNYQSKVSGERKEIFGIGKKKDHHRVMHMGFDDGSDDESDDGVVEAGAIVRSVQKRASSTISAHNIPNDVLFDDVESRLCIKVNARFAPSCTGCFRALDSEDNAHHISDRPVFIKEAGEGEVVMGPDNLPKPAPPIFMCFLEPLQKWAIVSKSYFLKNVKSFPQNIKPEDRKDDTKIKVTSWGRCKNRLPTGAKWRGSMSLEIVEVDFKIAKNSKDDTVKIAKPDNPKYNRSGKADVAYGVNDDMNNANSANSEKQIVNLKDLASSSSTPPPLAPRRKSLSRKNSVDNDVEDPLYSTKAGEPLTPFVDDAFPPSDHSLGKRSLCGLSRSAPVAWVHAAKLSAKGAMEKNKTGSDMMKL